MRRLPASLEILRERDPRRLFYAQAVSLLGDGMVNVALAFAVLHLGGSASDVGLVFAARMLPLVACLLAGGVVADRVPRRAVMVAADVVRLATQGTMAALLIGGGAELWMLGALAGAGGAASGFFYPAATGLVPTVVGPERVQQANALRGLAMACGEILGPVVAGVLVATAGAGWALGVDAVTFAVSAAFLLALRVPTTPTSPVGPFLDDLREGWNAFRSRTWVWTFVAAAAVGNMLGASWNVLGPVVADSELGGPTVWGLIIGTFGAGSLAGGLVALRVRPRRPLLLATLAVTFFAFPTALLAAGAPATAIAAVAFCSGCGLMVSNTVWESTLQRHIPTHALSRVSAYDWFGSMAFYPLGAALWGPLAEAIGISTALWLAFALQAASVLALLAVRDIRRLGSFPEPAAAAVAAGG